MSPASDARVVPTDDGCSVHAGRDAPSALWLPRVHEAIRSSLPRGWTSTVTPPQTNPASPPRASIDLLRGSRVEARLVVDPPDDSSRVRVRVAAVDAAGETTMLGRALQAIGVVAAVGGFGLWVWFAIHDWGRIWNRISSFSGPGPDRANKLEVLWLLVGWMMSPVIAYLIFALIAAGIDGLVNRLKTAARARRVRKVALPAVRSALDRSFGDAQI